jgi:hypothetical protein
MEINTLEKTVVTATAPSAVDNPPAEAPLQIELLFRLAVPPPEAFDLVAFRLPEWFGMIHSVTWDNARSDRGKSEVGVHSSRTCSIGGKELCEDIVAFEPGRTYSYKVDMARSTMKMPIKDHLGTFEVQPLRDGSLVTWRQYFRAARPMIGMIRWYMRSRLMIPALKSLVKNVGGEIVVRNGRACGC